MRMHADGARWGNLPDTVGKDRPRAARYRGSMKQILLPLALTLVAAPAAAQPGTSAYQALVADVERLESVRSIRTLQRAYGFFVDRALWAEAADLFTDDATMELGQDGVYVGRDRIHAYLARYHAGPQGPREGLAFGQLNEQMQLQPLITLSADGKTARARWRQWSMTGQFQKSAEWADWILENSYRREDGVWKISGFRAYLVYRAPYALGWARLREKATPPSAASRELPPDRPPTSTFRPFPAADSAPMHPGADQ